MPAPTTKEKKMRKFEIDHRSNPKLHALYVKWALEALQITNSALEELWDRSNWSFSQLAMGLLAVKTKLILEDAAFFEAAALIESGTDLEPYL